MTVKHILIIDGHPDADGGRFVHALADRYAEGADAGGHSVRRIEIATMAIDPLTSRHEWEEGSPSPAIAAAQADILWAEHIVLLYPLWLGDIPALLKAFFEQVMRPGFAFRYRAGGLPEKKLKGRTAHIVVTMGMPALLYRTFYGAHSLKSLERNILKFVGIAPVRRSVIGNVEGDGDIRDYWLKRMAASGRAGR
ncbi:NAD(P)H-dependent oxidoreductase [Sphingopyxis chilensis]